MAQSQLQCSLQKVTFCDREAGRAQQRTPGIREPYVLDSLALPPGPGISSDCPHPGPRQWGPLFGGQEGLFGEVGSSLHPLLSGKDGVHAATVSWTPLNACEMGAMWPLFHKPQTQERQGREKVPSVKPAMAVPRGDGETEACGVHGRAPHCSGGGTGAQRGFSCARGGGARWDGPRRLPPSRRPRPGQCTGAGQVPPAGQGRVQETPTGLQRALPHHRGEGAQALWRARRQAKGVLCVGFQVIHHEGRGRVEGPRDLGEGRGERPGWGERQTDRHQGERQTQTESDGDGEKRGGKCSKGRGKEEEEERYSGTSQQDRRAAQSRCLGRGEGASAIPSPTPPTHLSAMVAFPVEELVFDDALLPRGAPGEPDACL